MCENTEAAHPQQYLPVTVEEEDLCCSADSHSDINRLHITQVREVKAPHHLWWEVMSLKWLNIKIVISLKGYDNTALNIIYPA